MHLAQPLLPMFEYSIVPLLGLLPESGDQIWNLATFRQTRYPAQRATRTILFEWLDNNWRPSETPLVLRADYAPKKLAAEVYAAATALRVYRPGRIFKLMLADLQAGEEISLHTDNTPALTMVHRCHLPLISNTGVTFRIGGDNFYLSPGTFYEVDNCRPHAVRNASNCNRVHLICDIMPKAGPEA
jgi:aspartyl/asparaginyl beta-hydroxylase (cupin superfamily)